MRSRRAISIRMRVLRNTQSGQCGASGMNRCVHGEFRGSTTDTVALNNEVCQFSL